MYQFRRNQLIIMVLVFMIAIAGYLQLTTDFDDVSAFSNAGEDDGVEVLETNEGMEYYDEMNTMPPDFDVDVFGAGSAGADMEVIITKADATQPASSGNIITVSYFAEEKMLREQQRSAQISELNDYMSNTSIDEDTKTKVAQTLLDLQKKIEIENETESLLRAKGFDEVYVRMDDTGVDVIVNRASLSDEEVAQIEEVVSRKTEYRVSQIKIHMNAQSN
ncbi:MAG: hypothetical protein ATN36_03840 [Epulopiscium sp. Nele67-Bin005]|nr:MAG: hypothetical protein ATN36_03840 [Epulopiscium sp. Nele67-Bin005]